MASTSKQVSGPLGPQLFWIVSLCCAYYVQNMILSASQALVTICDTNTTVTSASQVGKQVYGELTQNVSIRKS